ncbi:YoaK family protein [Streptomyces flaveolus]|uniref:YoaK family protein n=1 Tax=Streptomyces flaveolus TaxID=67297 RepID=UPI0033B540EB
MWIDVWVTRLLAFSAGAVNAWGFLSLGGVFTSVVTANSAMIGIGLGDGRLGLGALAGLAVLGYVLGAAGGSWTAARAQRAARLRAADFLLLEAVLLWTAAAWWTAAGGHPGGAASTAMLGVASAAMGCQNAGVRVALGAHVATAYLTGMLTQAVAEAVTRRRLQRRALLTAGLLICGAAAFALFRRWLPGAAAMLPALLVTAAWLTRHTTPRTDPAAPV